MLWNTIYDGKLNKALSTSGLTIGQNWVPTTSRRIKDVKMSGKLENLL